jgi:diguanylate cyclase (GGDEF)-like protein/PAS domain S-box-containing protein
MGMGIWSMHYVGMLAFRLPVPVFYHYPTVIMSFLVAIAASAVALFTVSRERMELRQEIFGSLLMGGGIAAMHYIGMAAMRLPARMEFRWSIVGLSVVLAVVISFVALILAFHIRHEQKTSKRKVLSAVLMGSAIPLTHYTGMWAVRFHVSNAAIDTNHAVRIPSLGIAMIGITSFSVLMLVITTAFLDRLLTAQRSLANSAREGEVYFRTLAEAVPGIIWTSAPDGSPDFFNDRWHSYSGLSFEQSCGAGWTKVLHPDDLSATLEKWEHSLRTGESYEIEYRFRRASDGAYRWFLARANPVRNDKGEIIKWFGTCTDIEDQKHNQQILEEQIKDRTVELADANTRLQEEMWEKDSARRELDQQNERMMRELTERSQRATLLAKMGEHLQSCINKDEVFAAALGFAPKIFPTSRGAVALFNSGRNLVEVTGSWTDCKLATTVFEPTSCWALRTGHPHLVVAGDMTAPCAHASGVKNTYLCIPILAQGEALGILHLQATEEAPTLADSELSFKTTFAGQVGLSIANIRLREALRNQSIKDPLTGLYNRRYLEEMLEREIRRAVRAEQPLGILMLDLDHFKSFNDTYGHDAGDAVLRETATFVTKSIRVEDIVCRFGGEEFVVILPTADLDAARSRGERIRAKVKELTVLHQGQSVGRITVSIGVAALPMHGTSPKELFEAADAALYRAKREGRDRVVMADPPVNAETAASVVTAEISAQAAAH